VSLSGTGTAPVASISPTSLAFGNQSVNTASTVQSITLSNSGNAALSVSGIAVSGANASDFTQTNNCGSSVAAGANCTINVTFKPSGSGSRAASLTVTDNATNSPQAVSLSGTGASPLASVSPTSLAFASQSVGTTSAAQTVTLTNSGNATLNVTSIALSGANTSDFGQTNNCGSSVAAGAYCTISVTFTPSASGSRAASLSISDNAAGSPQSVSLTGTGANTPGSASLSPTSLSFTAQPVETTSSSQTVTLTNTGSTTLSVSSFTMGGTNSIDFVQNNNCGSTVAAGANCTIVVLFVPSATGARAATLSITDSATGSPQTVSMSGTGSHDVVLSWTASSSSGVIGYNVFRGTTPGGESSTPLNSTPINGTTYADASVAAGTEYYYLVTSVASDGVTQSTATPETTATVPTP
jgi:hypothetical protein